MAMVAKQGWHVMMQPDTMVARVFKVKYFPCSLFFELSLGNNPSYVWRSLWKTNEVLILGRHWRIEDGSKINVMFEPWLRSEGKWWVSAPQSQEMYTMKVGSIMLMNGK
ncbi:unnamed protein product [Lathyrus oleraceus]